MPALPPLTFSPSAASAELAPRLEEYWPIHVSHEALLFAKNPLPMWVYDVDTLAFLEVNDAAVAHYGYSRAEFLRMRITDIRPAEDVPGVRATVAALAATRPDGVRRHGRTWRHRLKDGRIRDVELASHEIEFSGRRAVLIVVMDVTDLKHTQAALTKSSERLELLHEIDRALIAAETPGAIAEAALRRLRELLDVPRAIVNLFDFESGEAEWLAAAGRRRIHVGPGIRFPLRLMGDLEALRRGERQVIDVSALPPSPHADALAASGVRTYMVVPMIAAGELIGAVSFGGASAEYPAEQVRIAEEVAAQMAIAVTQARLYERVKRQAEELEQRVQERTSELRLVNEQLQREIVERQRMEAEAAQANRAKSEFLSRMSHELRTPLNGIIGFAQLLELDALTAPQRESVDHILKGGRHLLALINEILDIARIEAGKVSISLEPVLAIDVVGSALDLVRPQAAAQAVSLTSAVPDALYLRADRQRLQQVLLNLLSNGVKYNRPGGRVTVSAPGAAAGRARIAVADTGSGIAAEMLPRLFVPFDRLGADAVGIEGTGLGLALSKRLVEAMEGALLVDSRVGEGTTFIIDLPGADVPAPVLDRVDGGAASGAAVAKRRGTLLYIEDNVANLRLFERIVAQRPGLALLSAMQGTRGLELARAHRPGAIVLDLHLPDLPGAEVLARLRDDPATHDIPVVILSADATPGQVSRLLAQGAQKYLTKPVDVSEVLVVLDSLFDDGGK